MIQNGPRKSSPPPVCTCPCDILSLALVIFSLALVYCVEWLKLVNSRAVSISPPTAGRPRSHVVGYGPGLLFRGPPCRNRDWLLLAPNLVTMHDTKLTQSSFSFVTTCFRKINFSFNRQSISWVCMCLLSKWLSYSRFFVRGRGNPDGSAKS
jgi:hypothetical protein